MSEKKGILFPCVLVIAIWLTISLACTRVSPAESDQYDLPQNTPMPLEPPPSSTSTFTETPIPATSTPISGVTDLVLSDLSVSKGAMPHLTIEIANYGVSDTITYLTELNCDVKASPRSGQPNPTPVNYQDTVLLDFMGTTSQRINTGILIESLRYRYEINCLLVAGLDGNPDNNQRNLIIP